MTIAKNETLEARLPETLASGGIRVTPTGPVTVDTELPAAAVPTDGDPNSAVPATLSRSQIWAPDLGSNGVWRRALAARGDGAGVSPQSVPASSQHVRGADGLLRQAAAAQAATDAEAGASLPLAAQMLYNGTTWERARAAYEETLLARAVRSTVGGGQVLSPVVTSRLTGAYFLLRVYAVPAAPDGGITVKVQMQTAIGSLSVLVQDSVQPVLVPGLYYYVLHPAAQATQSGIAAGGPGGSIAAGPIERPVVAASVPLPRQYALSVHHRGAANTGEWEYAVSAIYTR